MINLKKISYPKSPFPLMKVDGFLSKKFCKSLKEAIEKQKEFDDLVMNGRNRINKGSNNFKKFLSSSKEAAMLYSFLNSNSTFIKFLNFFKKKN